MELTPQQQVFNTQLVNDPDFREQKEVLSSLFKNQSDIMRTIEENEVETRDEFAKGTRKFEKLESEIKEVRNDMEDLKREMNSGFHALAQGLSSLRNEIKDDKMEKMSKQLEKMQQDKDKTAENVSTIKRNIIVGIALAAVGIVGAYLSMTLGLTPPSK